MAFVSEYFLSYVTCLVFDERRKRIMQGDRVWRSVVA